MKWNPLFVEKINNDSALDCSYLYYSLENNVWQPIIKMSYLNMVFAKFDKTKLRFVN